MIVAAAKDLILTTQTDHAAFAAELLSLWRADGLPSNPRRQPLLLAVREHDNGWAETDSAPRCRSDGRPHDFGSLPSAERLELWRRGVDRWRDREPAVAVYVVRHAVALHERHGTGGDGAEAPEIAEDWDEAMAEWRELQEELRREAELSPEELASDYRFLALADTLSLIVCARWSEPKTVPSAEGPVRAALETAAGDSRGTAPGSLPGSEERLTLRLDPFPLAGITTFRLRVRRIPDRRYEGDADLALELARATWDTVEIRIAPRAGRESPAA